MVLIKKRYVKHDTCFRLFSCIHIKGNSIIVFKVIWKCILGSPFYEKKPTFRNCDNTTHVKKCTLNFWKHYTNLTRKHVSISSPQNLVYKSYGDRNSIWILPLIYLYSVHTFYEQVSLQNVWLYVQNISKIYTNGISYLRLRFYNSYYGGYGES